MAKAFKIKGLDKLLKKVEKLPKEVVEIVDGRMELSCQRIVTKAKQSAPIKKGKLRQSISFNGAKLAYVISATANYSPYQEFGTGNRVKILSGLESYASQFKGSGKRQVNMKAQPFFFPSAFAEEPKMIKAIEQEIKKALDK